MSRDAQSVQRTRAKWGWWRLGRVAAAAALLMAVGSGGCPPPEDQNGQDTPLDEAPVVLSAEQIAGPGGMLIYQGEEITGEVEVPANALVGVYKDGQGYLYHPALGDAELSEYNSRRAVGYFLMNLSPPSKEAASRLADRLPVGGKVRMKSGVEVTHTQFGTCEVYNRAARWVAIKTRAKAKYGEIPYLPPNELNLPTTLVGAIDALTVGVFSASDTRSIQTPEYTVETYGAILRGAPLLAGLASTHPEVITGCAQALVHDQALFARVNMVDFTYSVVEALKSVGRIFSPFECVDLLVPEVALTSAEITAVGLLTGDAQALEKLVMDYAMNIVNSLVGCVFEVLSVPTTGATGTPVMIVLNQLQDILSAGKWIIDTGFRGARDVFRYPPWDLITLARPSLPQTATVTRTVERGDGGFRLFSGVALRDKGVWMQAVCTWLPEETGYCDPDEVPDLLVAMYGGQMLLPTLTRNGTSPRQFIVECNGLSDYPYPEEMDFSIQVFFAPETSMPPLTPGDGGDLPPCRGKFEVKATIRYDVDEPAPAP